MWKNQCEKIFFQKSFLSGALTAYPHFQEAMGNMQEKNMQETIGRRQ